MRLTRVHVDAPLGADATMLVEGAAANHIARVLRLRVGDALTLFDGRGGEYSGRVADMRRASVVVEVGGHTPLERESPLDLTLLQAIARGERMDFIVQKATELGVTRIVPVISERSVMRLEPDQAAKKLAHWRGVAVAACEQCGRNRLPQIAEARSLLHVLDPRPDGRGPGSDTLKLVLEPKARAPLAALLGGARQIALLVGPEGGFTEDEIELATRAGFQPCRMGERILRTETAAMACVAAIQTLAGDLGA